MYREKGAYKGKTAYLQRLTSKFKFKTAEVNEKLDGSTPPSIFVGRYGYPKVFLGPMMSTVSESFLYDTPELWLNSQQVRNNYDIVNFRMQLVRGKNTVGIRDESKYVDKIREIALASKSTEIEAEFKKKPRGIFFHEDMQPFGPSGELKAFDTGNIKFNQQIAKVYYDTDMRARDAVTELHRKGIFFSTIQKALSVGSFGLKKNRKLVPTRWSITAVDSTLADSLLQEVKEFETIETFRVYENNSLKNYFAILLLPSEWQYEMLEAFIKVLGNEQVLFSDYEFFHEKKEYSQIGGCYYSGKLAISEKLNQEQKQAGAVVFREAYPGYIPLGVWNVRENMRQALQRQPKEFSSLGNSLLYISRKLLLPISKFIGKSQVLQNFVEQKKLSSFLF